MKEAETSNSLLLLPECQMTAQSLNSDTQPTAVSRQVLLTLVVSHSVTLLLQTFTLLNLSAY